MQNCIFCSPSYFHLNLYNSRFCSALLIHTVYYKQFSERWENSNSWHIYPCRLFLALDWIIAWEETAVKSKDGLWLDYAILSVTAEELHAPTVFPLLGRFFPLLCIIYTKFINSARKLNLARSPEETKPSRVERMRLCLGEEWFAEGTSSVVETVFVDSLVSFIFLQAHISCMKYRKILYAFPPFFAFVCRQFLALLSATLLSVWDLSKSKSQTITFQFVKNSAKGHRDTKEEIICKASIYFFATITFLHNSLNCLGKRKILLFTLWTLLAVQETHFWRYRKKFVGDNLLDEICWRIALIIIMQGEFLNEIAMGPQDVLSSGYK